jgi:hypothetical protein
MRNHARKEEEKPTFLGISSAPALFCGISVLAHWNQSLHSSSRNIFSWYYKYKDHWNQTSEPLERCSAAGLVRDPAIVLASSRPRESPPPIRFRPLPTTNALPPHKGCSPHHQFQTNNEKEISPDFISIQIPGPEFHKREEKLRRFQAHNSRPRSPCKKRSNRLNQIDRFERSPQNRKRNQKGRRTLPWGRSKMKDFQRTKEVEFERQKIAFIHSVDPTAHLTPIHLSSFIAFFSFSFFLSWLYIAKNGN